MGRAGGAGHAMSGLVTGATGREGPQGPRDMCIRMSAGPPRSSWRKPRVSPEPVLQEWRGQWGWEHREPGDTEGALGGIQAGGALLGVLPCSREGGSKHSTGHRLTSSAEGPWLLPHLGGLGLGSPGERVGPCRTQPGPLITLMLGMVSLSSGLCPGCAPCWTAVLGPPPPTVASLGPKALPVVSSPPTRSILKRISAEMRRDGSPACCVPQAHGTPLTLQGGPPREADGGGRARVISGGRVPWARSVRGLPPSTPTPVLTGRLPSP